MLENLQVSTKFCRIYFCELPQATTFCGNYFYEFIANSLKKMSSFVLAWTVEKNSVWISTSYLRVILFLYSRTFSNQFGRICICVLQVSPAKRARSGSTESFDLTFQTEEEKGKSLWCLFFAWKVGTGTGSVIKTAKQSEFKLLNSATVKEKNLPFEKHDKKTYSGLITIINELQQYDHVHIQVRDISDSPKEVKNGLSLKEFTVTDDGKSITILTVFSDIIANVKLKSTYRISNA